MIIFLSLLVALIGILCYGFSVNPKVNELGRLAFAVGLLAFLLQDGQIVSLLHMK